MIDLDLAEHRQVPEHALVRPGTVRIVVAVVSVLLLGLLGGGDRMDTYRPVFRLHGSIQEAALVQDILVVMTTRPARLQAYRMPDGHRVWSRDLPASLAFMSGYRDLLFVTEYDGQAGASSRTRVLDGRSGRQLWQRTGLWIVAQSGDQLVSARSSSPDRFGPSVESPVAQGHIELSGLDARTGAVLWSRNLPAGSALTRADGGCPAGRPPGGGLDAFTVTASVGSPLPEAAGGCARLYDLGPDGVLHTRDPATGAVIASARLEVPLGPNLTVVGRVAMVRQRDGTMWASDVAGGRPLWQRAPDQFDGFAGPCGDAVCLSASDRTFVLDPVTGAQLYELVLPNTAYGAAGRIVAADRSLLRISLVDPVTGRRLAELEGWSATGMYAGTRLVAAQGGLDGPAWIAVVDLLTGRQRMIARGDRGFLLPTCTGSGNRLLCWNSSSLEVWSVGSSTLA